MLVPCGSPHYCLEGLSLDLKLAVLAKLAGPVSFQDLPVSVWKCSDYRQPCLAFMWMLEIRTQVLLLAKQAPLLNTYPGTTFVPAHGLFLTWFAFSHRQAKSSNVLGKLRLASDLEHGGCPILVSFYTCVSICAPSQRSTLGAVLPRVLSILHF